jgi:hypothetical protein
MTVTTSKKVGSRPEEEVRISSAEETTSLSVISTPSTLIRSVKLTRWGEVKSPVFVPERLSMEARAAAVEPLPFVPATWMLLNEPWGSPNRLSRARGLSRPSFIPWLWSP